MGHLFRFQHSMHINLIPVVGNGGVVDIVEPAQSWDLQWHPCMRAERGREQRRAACKDQEQMAALMLAIKENLVAWNLMEVP